MRKRRLAGVASCKAGFIELKRKRRREPERWRKRRRSEEGRGRSKSGPLNRSTCNYIDLTVSDDVDLSSRKGGEWISSRFRISRREIKRGESCISEETKIPRLVVKDYNSRNIGIFAN